MRMKEKEEILWKDAISLKIKDENISKNMFEFAKFLNQGSMTLLIMFLIKNDLFDVVS